MRGGDEKRRTRTPSSTRPWPGPQAAQPPYTSFQNPPMATIPAEYGFFVELGDQKDLLKKSQRL
jgi:hypothetical protein